MLSILKSEVKNHFPVSPVCFNPKAFGDTKPFSKIIEEHVPELKDGASFFVNPLLASGHLQTAYTALHKFEDVDMVNYRRIVLNIEDKTYETHGENLKYDHWQGESSVAVDFVVSKDFNDDTLRSDDFRPPSQQNELPARTYYLDPIFENNLLKDDSKPLVIALHGLSGGSYETYIRAFLLKITEEPYNFDALVLNSRGCANHTITSPQLFSGVWTNDLRYLINEYIKKRFPNKRIYLIGFSLGGAILSNYLGQESDEVYINIKGACIVGCPYDFTDGSFFINENLLGRLAYSPTMCQNLVKLLVKNYSSNLKFHSLIEEYQTHPEKFNLKLLKDFDEAFTSKLLGFNSAAEYYRHASPIQRLSRIRVPTLLLSALDDPVTGSRSLPYLEISVNPYLALTTTSKGGHLGFFNLTGGRWYPDPISKLFKELDDNWNVENVSKKDLPSDLSKIWKYDRMV